MIKITERAPSRSGITLGGLGTGSVEIRPDGEFHEWQIANNGEWKEDCREKESVEDNSIMQGSGLTFFIRTQENDEIKMRKLALTIQEKELRSCMFSWLKPVEEIQFQGTGPIAELSYMDSTLQIQIKMKAIAPMIPHDEVNSAAPGFYVTFQVENTDSKSIQCSLLGKLQNPICQNDLERKLKNIVTEKDGITYISLSSDSTNHQDSYNGSICISAEGGEISYISGDYRSYIDSYIAGSKEFGISEESILFPFRRKGVLPNTTVSKSIGNGIWLPDSEISKLEDKDRTALILSYKKYAFVQSLEERILEVDEKFFQKKENQISFIRFIRECVEEFEGKKHGDTNWGDCALSSSFTLAPKEIKEVTFTISWYFPNHYSKNGHRLGHMYENLFSDAYEVNQFLNRKRSDFNNIINAFTSAMTDTSFHSAVSDSWMIHLTTLIKSSWWLKDGRFAIWEGIGSCGFHTTDITYHASFPLIALYPELQKRQMLMGADFQNEDGRVHHFFTPDLSTVDDGFSRVDMNSQFVLLVCRDYLWTGDEEYLKKLYPNVVAAIDALLQLDTNQDGLLDIETRHNTYDAWNFFGTPSYIESLWLSCLKAGALLADFMSDQEHKAQYLDLLERGKDSMKKVLWNGQYFDLWNEDNKKDSCCMSDQLDGEWFARIIGLGGIFPDEDVKTALMSILNYNYSEENGLINASYPLGTEKTIYTYRNCQAEANWTGIEYAFASFLFLLGEDRMATEIVKNVDRRYRLRSRIWNHMECGDHYSRAMSAFATLSAATGFLYHKPEHILHICPTGNGEMHGPFITSTAFGKLEKTADMLTLHTISGKWTLRTMVLTVTSVNILVSFNNHALPYSADHSGDFVRVTFDSDLTLQKGDILTVMIQTK